MSPSRKRAAVDELREQFSISERRACQTLDQPRSTQRYQAQPRDDEAGLVKRMLAIAVLTAVQNGGAGDVSRRSKLAAR